MKTLFIGDIVGRAGRQIVIDQLPDLRKKEKIDWVIANAENLAGGRGINQSTIKEITAAGVDVV
ncbi:YmdB family metallophosphoesterase, partial [Patescibacteria group bacterium]|nr:YmdB family metallophosphoesterase [Patescibacteria group bacterium]